MNKKHIFLYRLLRPLTVLFVKVRFGYRYEKARDLPENYIVLSNHTTDYDLLFVAASFKKQMYFIGSEHIARWKGLYRLLKFAFDPIMRPKGASAASTVKEMMRRSRAGANLCLFPEGIRSWNGSPSPITPSTAKMVRRLGCGLVTYRITGGYFASPMWGGAGVRRGKVRGAPVHILTALQVQAMSSEELYEMICADLGEDAYERQLAHPTPYKSKAGAEGLENLLFTCPQCLGHDTFRTHGDSAECIQCGMSFRYDPYGMLQGAPFRTLKEFDLWQRDQVRAHAERGGSYRAGEAELSTLRDHREQFLCQGELVMDGESLRCGDTLFPLSSITDLAMHGQHHLVFTADGTYYEIRVKPPFNALKFFLFYNQCRKMTAERI